MRRTRALRAAVLLPAALILCGAWPPAVAHAGTTATLHAAFSPERLGRRTTLDFGFSFSAPPGQVPPPLTQVQLRYPANIGIGLSGLGKAECSAQALEERGPTVCPPNSVMGYGVVATGIVLGNTQITESAPITVFRAPYEAGHLALLFYAQGTRPVSTTVIFPGLLLPAPVPFGGQVSIGVPLVETLPGAPYISVLDLRATIGPQKVTYYEKVGGLTLAFRPKGILLPPHCPRGGFPFSAEFGFSDGEHTRARTAIRCPKDAPGRHRKHGGRGGRRRHTAVSGGSGARRSRPSPRRPHRPRRSPRRL